MKLFSYRKQRVDMRVNDLEFVAVIDFMKNYGCVTSDGELFLPFSFKPTDDGNYEMIDLHDSNKMIREYVEDEVKRKGVSWKDDKYERKLTTWKIEENK